MNFCNSQFGNNNAYCQDNETSWLNWNQLQENHDMFLFFKQLIAFRKEHPLFRRASEGTPKNYPAVSLHGINPWQFDSSHGNRVVCIMLTGKTEDGRDDFYLYRYQRSLGKIIALIYHHFHMIRLGS